MNLEQAFEIAEGVRSQLAPFCKRIEIAGSIRRKKPEVKDIEIVCIPKTFSVTEGLFGEKEKDVPIQEFVDTVRKWEKVRGEPFGKYTQRKLPQGINLDLFIATQINWATILLIRTGSAEFSKQFMGSWLPRHGYKCADGMITKTGMLVIVPTEESLFRLVKMNYLEPQNRNL